MKRDYSKYYQNQQSEDKSNKMTEIVNFDDLKLKLSKSNNSSKVEQILNKNETNFSKKIKINEFKKYKIKKHFHSSSNTIKEIGFKKSFNEEVLSSIKLKNSTYNFDESFVLKNFASEINGPSELSPILVNEFNCFNTPEFRQCYQNLSESIDSCPVQIYFVKNKRIQTTHVPKELE